MPAAASPTPSTAPHLANDDSKYVIVQQMAVSAGSTYSHNTYIAIHRDSLHDREFALLQAVVNETSNRDLDGFDSISYDALVIARMTKRCRRQCRLHQILFTT